MLEPITTPQSPLTPPDKVPSQIQQASYSKLSHLFIHTYTHRLKKEIPL